MAKDYWETPYDVVANIAKFMDTPFTIDVACELHNAKAPIAITDALTADWSALQDEHRGAIWCNPPYSDPSPWVTQFEKHDVTAAMLVNAGTSADWFHRALGRAAKLLVPKGRIGFYDPDIGTIQTKNDRSQVVFIFERGHVGPCEIISVSIETIQSVRKAIEYSQTYGHMHKKSAFQNQLAELSELGL